MKDTINNLQETTKIKKSLNLTQEDASIWNIHMRSCPNKQQV